MEKEGIRKKLHNAIDEMESEEHLQNACLFVEPAATYKSVNWLENLSAEQSVRLNKSLDQAEKGEFIDHETVKAKYAQWLS